MLIEHTSMTDTVADMAAANQHFGMESEVVTGEQGEELAAAVEPTEPAEPEPHGTTEAPLVAEGETAPTPEAGEETQEQPAGSKKEKGGLQARFKELTDARDAEKNKAQEAQQKLDQALEELNRLRAGEPEPKPAVAAEPAPAPKVEAKPKPKREDFYEAEDPDGAYFEAIADWKAEKAAAPILEKLAKVENDLQAERGARAEEASRAQYNAQRSRMIEKYPDFAEVVEGPNAPAAQVEINGVIADVMLNDPARSPEIAYWLAKNTHVANQIAAATIVPEGSAPAVFAQAVMTASRWLAHIERELGIAPALPGAPPSANPRQAAPPAAAAPAQPKPAAQRRAPAPPPEPITPVGAGGGARRRLADITDSTEWRAAYEAGVR